VADKTFWGRTGSYMLILLAVLILGSAATVVCSQPKTAITGAAIAAWLGVATWLTWRSE